MKIAVRAPNWLGDAVLATPALSVLGKEFPEWEITVAARPPLWQVFQNHPAVKEVLELPGKEASFLGQLRGTYLRAAGILRKQEFDLGVLLPNSFSSAFLFRLAKIPQIAGYATDCRRLLLTRPVKVPREAKAMHQSDYYLHLMDSLGGGNVTRSSLPGLVWVITEEEEELTSRFLAEEKGIGRDQCLLGIAPGASYGEAKKWFPERFAIVADSLAKKFGLRILILGAQQDREAAAAVKRKLKGQAVDLTGETHLRLLGAITRRLTLLIANDSGLLHVAAAVETPAVGVYGPTIPGRTRSRNGAAAVVKGEADCAPCTRHHCPVWNHPCMSSISVEAVKEEAEKLLKGRG